MEELGKIDKAIKKLDTNAPQHRLLVLDATLGLNTLAQAQAFAEVVKLTGLIVTKLDGSAKAGAVVPLYGELRLPVYFAGLGEGIDELKAFGLEEYLEGLLGAD
jgi:fused signal recognition particle receptor